MRPSLGFFSLLAAFALPAGAQQNVTQAAADERPVSGAFTEAQAARGDTTFQLFCAACHDQSDHTGDKFRSNWYGRTLQDYFSNVRAKMPDDNPGGLTDAQYLWVTAYIMKLNGYAPGSDSLVADTIALKRIRIGSPRPPGQ